MAEINLEGHKDQYSEAHLETKDVGEAFDVDEVILRAQGHTAQLERSFSWMGALGLAFRSVHSHYRSWFASMLTLLIVS